MVTMVHSPLFILTEARLAIGSLMNILRITHQPKSEYPVRNSSMPAPRCACHNLKDQNGRARLSSARCDLPESGHFARSRRAYPASPYVGSDEMRPVLAAHQLAQSGFTLIEL